MLECASQFERTRRLGSRIKLHTRIHVGQHFDCVDVLQLDRQHQRRIASFV